MTTIFTKAFGAGRSHRHELRVEDWRRGIAGGDLTVALATVNDAVVAMAVSTPNEGMFELMALYVLEQHRRHGIATALTKAAIAAARAANYATIVLHVTPNNQPALALYRRLGFSFNPGAVGITLLGSRSTRG
jgi:ribosomal protein S18 acetylase RimI-like enzyme